MHFLVTIYDSRLFKAFQRFPAQIARLDVQLHFHEALLDVLDDVLELFKKEGVI